MGKSAPPKGVEGLDARVSRFQIGPGLTARTLEIFVAVARCGSMSAAADRLGLSQPAVSQAIVALETGLGAKLLDRSARPPTLTLRGTAVLKQAAAVIDELEKFESALRLGTDAQLPLLRIGMLNSVAATMGPQIVSRLRNFAAEFSIESHFESTRIEALIEREVDFVVTSDEAPVPAGFEQLPIMTEPVLAVLPARYRGNTDSLRAICETLDLVGFLREPRLAQRVDLALREEGIELRRRYHFDTNDAVLQMVIDGHGWTVLTPLAVLSSIERGRKLRAIPYPDGKFERTIKVVFRESEGQHLAEHIRDAAVQGLKDDFLPRARKLIPAASRRIILH